MWTASCPCGDTAFFHNPKYDDITCIRHLKMWQTPNGDTSVHECDKLLIRDTSVTPQNMTTSMICHLENFWEGISVYARLRLRLYLGISDDLKQWTQQMISGIASSRSWSFFHNPKYDDIFIFVIRNFGKDYRNWHGY